MQQNPTLAAFHCSDTSNAIVLSLLHSLPLEYDYLNSTYRTPFNRLYNDYANRYVNYSIPFPVASMSYVKTGDIRAYNASIDKSDILLMFGASSNHATYVVYCILSFVIEFPFSPVVFVDYGLKPKDSCYLLNTYRVVNRIWAKFKSSAALYHRIYNWSAFPNWMQMDALNHGGYTWKPIAIADVFAQWKAVVMWNDAGSYFSTNVPRALTVFRRDGVYIPEDFSSFEQQVHTASYRFLMKHGFARPFNYSVKMGRACFMLFDYRNTICRKSIMLPWVQCAYTRQCMTLVGVNKTYHLPEQGVLSLIMMNNNKSAFTTIHFRPYNSHDPPGLDNKYIRGALESIRTRANIHATVKTLYSC